MRPSSTILLVVTATFLAVACTQASPNSDVALEEMGRAVAEDAGCFACHSVDGGSGIGPTWLDLFGSEVELEDGTTVIADVGYLRRSVVDPQAEVVAGYEAVMPSGFGEQLTDEEIEAIISFIRSLS